MAQMEERLLPTLEVLCSNPVLGNFYRHAINCIEKTKIIEKWPGMAQFFNKVLKIGPDQVCA